MTVKGGVPSPYAETLRRLSDARGISMRQLAVRAGLGLDAVRNITRGRAAEPRADTMMRLAEALGVSLDELYGREMPSPAVSTGAPPPGFLAVPVLALDIIATERSVDHPERRTGAALVLPERWLVSVGMEDSTTIFSATLPPEGWFVGDYRKQPLARGAVYIAYDGADFVPARLGRDSNLIAPGGLSLVGFDITARVLGRLAPP